MSGINEQRATLKELTEGSMAFFREARNGAADVEQANVGSRFAGRVISAIGMDLRLRLAAPRLTEIEQTGEAA